MNTSPSQTYPSPEYPMTLLGRQPGPIEPPIEFGAYRLQTLVRRSNMSLLCRGLRHGTQEPVAVKICLPGADPNRFQREIQHTQNIRIKGVIKIEDVGMTRDGCPYYATRWIKGPSLAERLADSKVPLEGKLEVVEELCRIVGILHEKGLSHRDLKPSNVMIEDDGKKVVLLDLGLARADQDKDLTLSGEFAGGTPGYIPHWVLADPNQGQAYQRQWDVYSLGVILVEALTGQRPKGQVDARFTAASIKVLLKEHHREDRGFDALLQACLAEKPGECPEDADTLFDRVRQCRGLPGSVPGRRLVTQVGVGLAFAVVVGALVMAVAFPETRRDLGDRIHELALGWEKPGTGLSRTGDDDAAIAPVPNPLIIPNPSLTSRTLRVRVWPEGASVRVVDHQANGRVLAEKLAPASGELEFDLPEEPAAQYGLVVFKPGHQTIQQLIRAGSDAETIEVQAHLDRLRSEVLLKTTPGASLTLTDALGASRTVGPVESGGELRVQSLEEGDWSYRIELVDHEPATGRIPGLVHGKEHLLDSPLKPMPGRLSVVGHPTMTIWHGENRLHPSDGWIELPAGVHDLQLRRPGFRSEALRVEIPPNRSVSRVAPEFTAESVLSLEPITGRKSRNNPESPLPDTMRAVNGWWLGLAIATGAGALVAGLAFRKKFKQQLRFISVGHRIEPPERDADPGADLVAVSGAGPAPLDGLLAGSQEAQQRQVTAAKAANRPLEVRTSQFDIALRFVPAGTFIRGRPANEASRGADEAQFQVSMISRAFNVGKHPVTQSTWQAVMGSNSNHFKAAGAAAPVERVSWNDANDFLNRLCERLGVARGTYRLLTETEWEYACRAGTIGATYGPLDEIAWYGGNSGNTTRKVGGKRPNAFGLYDMLGNVWEWCSDWYGPYPTGAQTDPSGPGDGAYRVVRGGSWYEPSAYCCSAYRSWNGPGGCNRNLGFRLARTIP